MGKRHTATNERIARMRHLSASVLRRNKKIHGSKTSQTPKKRG